MKTETQEPSITQVKERTAADLLNIAIAALGEISKISLPTNEVAVEFEWNGLVWKVDKHFLVVFSTNGSSTWARDLETKLMEKLLVLAEKSLN